MPRQLKDLAQGSCIVIVDGCSNGKHYAKQLKTNFVCVHVQSLEKPPEFYLSGFEPKDYVENIVYSGDVNELLRKLEDYNPSRIIAGSEFGVDLTELLLTKLDLPSNDLSVPYGRRNKHVMSQLVKSAGLQVVPEFKTDNPKAALEWGKTVGWPLVVKALDGAGGSEFRLCKNEEEVFRAFSELMGVQHSLSLDVKELLVQKFMVGVEYSINTVSCNGVHYIVDVQKYTKADLPNGKRIYLEVALQNYEEISQLPGMLDYLYGVLNSIGITLGPAHTEIMYTADGPVLMETSARPGGGLPAPIVASCLSIDQVSAAICAYTKPSEFPQVCVSPYTVKQYFSLVHLVSRVTGVIANIRHLDDIRSLTTFHCAYGFPRVGESVDITDDLDNIPGYVCLTGSSRDQIAKDCEAIRQFESVGLFEVAIPAANLGREPAPSFWYKNRAVLFGGAALALAVAISQSETAKSYIAKVLSSK